jgi:hypothetical protein
MLVIDERFRLTVRLSYMCLSIGIKILKTITFSKPLLNFSNRGLFLFVTTLLFTYLRILLRQPII